MEIISGGGRAVKVFFYLSSIYFIKYPCIYSALGPKESAKLRNRDKMPLGSQIPSVLGPEVFNT